jgi:SAM-dependent methyltransferase
MASSLPMRTIVNNTSLPGFFAATAMPDRDWWQALWPEPKKVFAALGIPSGLEVVDLCCGDGLFTVPLARMSRHVIGIDIDPRMLAITRAKLAAGGVTNCDLIEGDAYAIAELVRTQAHFVLMANTFHGVPDKPRLVRAVAAVLKPGGEFAVINWHRWPREETTVLGKPRGPKTDIRMEPPETAAIIIGSDFTLARVVELPPYHYAAIFRRI